ncbi:MAG: type III pantothenate kinase [Prevotellaceae bacterium]|jgi:type III pantothenate kinase|nr:type III pantothenate kinase [Prevotellaceae bacterium]
MNDHLTETAEQAGEKTGSACKWLLDIGNTAAKIAVADHEKLLAVRQCETITDDILRPLAQTYRPAVAVVASVRKDTDAEQALLQRYAGKIIFCTPAMPLPVRNLYATPETLGFDRLAAAVGAHHLFPQRNCMIIDCGTAMTIDFVSSHGEFSGGNISPGLQMRFKALHRFTAQLPMGAATGHVAAVGTTTQEALEAGVVHGIVHELEGYMSACGSAAAIFTGGDAIYFAKRIKNPIFVIRNLNFTGLAKIADYNAHL